MSFTEGGTIVSAAQTVRKYLDSLAGAPSRKGTSGVKQVRERLERIEQEITETANPVARLHLHQQAVDLREQLDAPKDADLEAAFIGAVAQWASRNDVSYAALRSAGVPARVLRQAGMKP